MEKFKDYFAMPINNRINFRSRFPYYEYMIGTKANGLGVKTRGNTSLKICQMYYSGKISYECCIQMILKENRVLS